MHAVWAAALQSTTQLADAGPVQWQLPPPLPCPSLQCSPPAAADPKAEVSAVPLHQLPHAMFPSLQCNALAVAGAAPKAKGQGTA
jgi:hypothetical protein